MPITKLNNDFEIQTNVIAQKVMLKTIIGYCLMQSLQIVKIILTNIKDQLLK